MDGVLVDYPSGIAQLSQETQKEYEGRLYAVPGVFSLMKPLEGALDAFETLSKVYMTVTSFRPLHGIIRVHGATSINGSKNI